MPGDACAAPGVMIAFSHPTWQLCGEHSYSALHLCCQPLCYGPHTLAVRTGGSSLGCNSGEQCAAQQVWRGAAVGVGHEEFAAAAYSGHDSHAHPAHPGPGGPRRPGTQRHRGDARGAPAGRHHRHPQHQGREPQGAPPATPHPCISFRDADGWHSSRLHAGADAEWLQSRFPAWHAVGCGLNTAGALYERLHALCSTALRLSQ